MKIIVITFISLIIGAISGCILVIKLFAIDIDLLALPYSNTPVVLMENITIEQDQIAIKLPKGSEITYKYSLKGMPVYSVDVIGNLDLKIVTKPIDRKGYFYVLQ